MNQALNRTSKMIILNILLCYNYIAISTIYLFAVLSIKVPWTDTHTHTHTPSFLLSFLSSFHTCQLLASWPSNQEGANEKNKLLNNHWHLWMVRPPLHLNHRPQLPHRTDQALLLTYQLLTFIQTFMSSFIYLSVKKFSTHITLDCSTRSLLTKLLSIKLIGQCTLTTEFMSWLPILSLIVPCI